MDKSIEQLLSCPTEDLPVFDKLKAFMKMHGMRNLSDVLRYNIPELNDMDGFSAMCLHELQKLLDRYDSLHLLNQWNR